MSDNDKKDELKKGPVEGSPEGGVKLEEKSLPSSIDEIIKEKMRLADEQTKLEQIYREKFEKNITVMFTDIKGSTAFFEQFGDMEGRAMVQKHNEMLFPCVLQNTGKIIKTIGDAIMATYESPAAGVRAAIEMQKCLEKHNKELEVDKSQRYRQIGVRIGLNYGPGVVEEHDVFGDVVNAAARVESQADAGQIMISEELYKQVRTEDDILCRFFGEATVKGKAEPIKIYRVVWSEEQLVQEGEFKKASTRRSIDKRGKVTKGRVFELVVTRENGKMRLSVLERARHEEKTVSQFDMVKLDDKLINKECEEIVNLLNRANKRGKVTKEILKQLQAAGQNLYDHLLTAEAKQRVGSSDAEDLIIRMDDRLVKIPWELLFDGKQFLCQRFSMGRIVATRQKITDVATRVIQKPLKMLILADPRGDLPASAREGTNIRDELDPQHELISANLKASDIPVDFIKSKVRDYDVIHYAGHADYDSDDPSNSGWLVADGKVSANDIRAMAGKKPMPALVFANGCQSGQTEEWQVKKNYEEEIFGLANAFLISGVQHYIGTFWDILDDPGQDFALAFYKEMMAGCSIGEAVRRARLALIDKYGEDTIVWASYMLYGDPSFSYLEEVAAAEESTQEAAAMPQAAGVQAFTQQGIPVVLRGTETVAFPMARQGMSGTAKAIIAILVLLVIGLGYWFYKGQGISVTVPADQIDAAFAKMNKGDLDPAFKDFESISQSKGKDRAIGFEGMAAVSFLKNDLPKAKDLANKALELDNQTIYARVVLGNIAYNQGDLQNAAAAYKAAASATDGKDWMKAEAYNKLGRIASDQGNKEGALAEYQKAVQSDGGNEDAKINLGSVLLALGKPAEAKEVFTPIAQGGSYTAEVMLAKAQNSMDYLADKAKQEEYRQSVSELAQAWKSNKAELSKPRADEWTSAPLSITFIDFKGQGQLAMEGENEFLRMAATEALRKSGRVEVVEREKIDMIINELKLSAEQLTSQETQLKLGKLFAAQIIATGSIARFRNEAQVSLQLIETETGRIKISVAPTMPANATSADIGKELAKQIVDQIQSTYPLRGKIIDVESGDNVVLNIGAKQGLTPGLKMEIKKKKEYRAGDRLITRYEKVGAIEITNVEDEVGYAKITEKPEGDLKGLFLEEIRS